MNVLIINNDRDVNLHNGRYLVNYNFATHAISAMEFDMSRSEQKQQTRQRILDAVGRGFRKGGFGGVGVDGLAKEAGVTSGAFYVHFNSKATAFREAVAVGLAGLKEGVRYFQTTYGATWWPEFVRFYLGTKRRCDLAESCALQSLAPEVARADDAARAQFETGLREVAAIIVSGPASDSMPSDEKAALTALATLVGAVTLGRAIADETLADQIAAAAEQSLLQHASIPVEPKKSRRTRAA